MGTCRYLDYATNIVLIGPPGTKKTHLAVGLARAAAHAGYRSTSPHRRSGGPLPPCADRGTLGHHHALLCRSGAAGD
nr:ATP-binding protein [Mycobacterium sp. E735]